MVLRLTYVDDNTLKEYNHVHRTDTEQCTPGQSIYISTCPVNPGQPIL